jgi:GT2 family glycosyltransferase
MDLSILIVSWNVRPWLLDCLQSIYANPPAGSFEVIVVDNASQDGSPAAVQAAYPQARLLQNTANPGFAAANNQAIQVSQGRYVLLLNPDTCLHPGALSALTAFLEANPQAGACGPRLLNPGGSLQISSYPFPTVGREFWRLFHLDRLRPIAAYPAATWDSSAPQPVDVIQGACLLLRRSVLDQVGLLDTGYFMYTEEVDLCYRVRRAGHAIFWLPGAQVTHHGGQSTRQAALPMFLSLYQTKLRFIRKHHGPLAGLAYRGVLAAAALPRILGGALPFGPSSAARRQVAANYRALLRSLPTL